MPGNKNRETNSPHCCSSSKRRSSSNIDVLFLSCDGLKREVGELIGDLCTPLCCDEGWPTRKQISSCITLLIVILGK